LSPLGNGRDWKDPDLSQFHRRNVWQVRIFISLFTALDSLSCSSFSHVFWVDASSYESIAMSLKGISSIPAAQASGVDGSVESALQWISCIQEEWLVVFDNADDPSLEVVAKFIPPGNRGNILITSQNQIIGRVLGFENIIEISEMKEPDAIALLLKTGYLAEHLQAVKNIVAKLGGIPLVVGHGWGLY